MASAESGSVPSEMGYGEGCPLSSRLGNLGSVVSRKRIWAYFEGLRMLYFVPI